jgi:uncharacterized membrane protein (UPF0127 family)
MRGVQLLLPLLVLLAACGDDAPATSGLTPLEIVAGDGTVAVLQVEVADTAAERRLGLSGRDLLAADHGMLFVIERRGTGFWMKDTRFPLSIAFVDGCGVILDIQDMEAYSLELHHIEAAFSYGLEANRGWFATNGVAAGDQVRLASELTAATCV